MHKLKKIERNRKCDPRNLVSVTIVEPVVVPTLNGEPSLSAPMYVNGPIVAIAQLSLATTGVMLENFTDCYCGEMGPRTTQHVALYVTSALQVPARFGTVCDIGHVTFGASLSFTTTLNDN